MIRRHSYSLLLMIFFINFVKNEGFEENSRDGKEEAEETLTITATDFLDDLSSSTADDSVTSQESYSPSSMKSKRFHASLSTIPEESFSVDEDGNSLKKTKAGTTNTNAETEEAEVFWTQHKGPEQPPLKMEEKKQTLKGPSEEDRSIDDKLKFLVPYYEIYENMNGPNSSGKRFLFVAGLTVLLVVLFYLMYSISSDYLTPSLAHLSSACHMSTDMAGLTFLAFGNGAPDLFTAMLGAEDAPEMILGSSIGSGLFIFTVVFGLVIIFARDPISSEGNAVKLLAFPVSKSDASKVKIGRGTFWRNALMYAGCIVALGVFVVRREVSLWQPFSLILIFLVYLSASILAHYFLPSKKSTRRADDENTNTVSAAEEGASKENENDASAMSILDIERRRHTFKQNPLSTRLRSSFLEITEWSDMGMLMKSFWILTSPLRLLLNLTILPLPDQTLIETPDRLIAHWFLSRLFLLINPFFSVLFIGWLSGGLELITRSAGVYWASFVYFSISLGTVGLLHLGAGSICNPLAGNEGNWRHSLPLWIATVYSFTCCIAWIYAVSNELVAVLSSLGLVLGVSRTVMGCLVLAWGNSIGDLIADVALARNGAPQTAITAIFSGPVQNVLLTIGISFMTAAARSPGQVVHLLNLRGDIHLTLALLALVLCASIIIIPGYFKYRIPRSFGVFLVLLYIVYVPFGVYLGIGR